MEYDCLQCSHSWSKKGKTPPKSCPQCFTLKWQKNSVRLRTDMEKASAVEDKLKPSVQFFGDRKTYYPFYFEGLEGYNKKTSQYISERDGRPYRVYLNYGYFKIKPEFVIAKNEGTSDPSPKTRKGSLFGIFEVKDALTGDECVLWCYTTPGNKKKWEPLKKQLDYLFYRLKENELFIVDEDGYLPIVLKMGKVPDLFGTKYAKIVAWDEKFLDMDFNDYLVYALEHEDSDKHYDSLPFGPRISTPFEGTHGRPRYES